MNKLWQKLMITLSFLYAPFAKTAIKSHPRGFSYIPVEAIINRLNAVVTDWNLEILNHHVYEAKTPKGGDTKEVVVQVRLTLYIDNRTICREAFGAAQVGWGEDGLGFTGAPIGDAFKAAGSDALKKTATLFGIGLNDLYPNADTEPFNPQVIIGQIRQSCTPEELEKLNTEYQQQQQMLEALHTDPQDILFR